MLNAKLENCSTNSANIYFLILFNEQGRFLWRERHKNCEQHSKNNTYLYFLLGCKRQIIFDKTMSVGAACIVNKIF